MPRCSMNEIDLAYLAGIIDGEGCISISRCKQKPIGFRYVLRVYITTTDKILIDWITTRIDVKIYLQKEHPRHFGKLPVFKLYVSNEDAKNLLKRVLKYLVIKKERARLILDEYPGKFVVDKKQRESVYNRLKIQNQRGSLIGSNLSIPSQLENFLMTENKEAI